MTREEKQDLISRIDCIYNFLCKVKQLIDDDSIGDELNNERANLKIEVEHFNNVLFPHINVKKQLMMETKTCYCSKCNSEFQMPKNFHGVIVCESCDPFMNNEIKI